MFRVVRRSSTNVTPLMSILITALALPNVKKRYEIMISHLLTDIRRSETSFILYE